MTSYKGHWALGVLSAELGVLFIPLSPCPPHLPIPYSNWLALPSSN